METLEQVNRVEYVYTDVELNKLIVEFLSEINNFIKENDYQISDESAQSLKQMQRISWVSYTQNMSKSMKKKINKNINRFMKFKTIRSANRFLHFLYSNVLVLGDVDKKEVVMNKWWTKIVVTPKGFRKVKIMQPIKHLTIQEKRKKWLEARAVADKLLIEYKEEKDDYYKLRMENRLNI